MAEVLVPSLLDLVIFRGLSKLLLIPRNRWKPSDIVEGGWVLATCTGLVKPSVLCLSINKIIQVL
jgi:hypothetical protein